MTQQNTGAFVMQLTGNPQGEYWFYSLITDRLLSCYRWTTLLMTTDVLYQVQSPARKDVSYVILTTLHNENYDKDNNDYDYEIDNESDPDLDSLIV